MVGFYSCTSSLNNVLNSKYVFMDLIELRKIALQIAKKITPKNSGITGLLGNAEYIFRCILEGNFSPEIDKQD
jgi:hypothetical protein